ncbi:MAG: NAD(+) synthase [Bacillota bacterium]
MADLNCEVVEKKLVTWLRKKVDDAGASGGIVGLSGGLDSSVTAVLAQKAFGENVLGLILPCYSSKEDRKAAEKLAQKFSLEYRIKNLDPLLEEFMEIMEGDRERSTEDSLAVANVKPRLRMTVLYYYAARKNYLVIGTDNWSELKVGYFTKHGDGGVDLAPLGRLVKTEVRQLAEYLDIPREIIEKPPSAGLWEGQTDEKEMGFSYQELDHYILEGEAEPEVKEKIEELAQKSSHKLAPIPVPERDYLREK